MDMRGKRQASSVSGGMGFYIALLVCVIAAGAVGYFALLNDGEEPVILDAPVTDPVDVVTGGDVTLPGAEDTSGDAHLVLTEEPGVTETIVSLPEQTVTEEPEGDVVETGGSETLEIPVSGGEETVQEPEPEAQTRPAAAKIVSPLMGETVAVFSVDRLMYDATLGDWRTHDGIDICAEAGTAVVATAAGTVIAVGEDGRMGVTIQIEHSGGYVTTYASLHPETQVEVGDSVEAGDVIGAVGNTSLSEAGIGAHLHFAVTRGGESIDPETYLPREE